jgi:hypothetical protein
MYGAFNAKWGTLDVSSSWYTSIETRRFENYKTNYSSINIA